MGFNQDGTYETQFKMTGKVTTRFEDGTIEMFGTIEWEGMTRDNMYIRFDPQGKSGMEIYSNREDMITKSN
jgi:hypothetical protein